MSQGRPSRSTHGEYGYARRHKCQCEPCLTAQRRYAKGLNFDLANGRSRRVPVGPVREHVQRLLDMGVNVYQISGATDPKVFDSMIRNIMHGNKVHDKEVEWVHRSTAARLLAVTYEAAAAVPALVPSIGIHRRMQALEYMGHAKSVIARELGIDETAVHQYFQRETCKTTTIKEMHAVYERLAMVEGASERVRWAARRRGWKPPMAWDDETIDDPTTKPFPVVCIVARCSREAKKASLCPTHWDHVSQRNGFTQARYYRAAVLALGRRQAHDRQRLVSDLADLKEQGLTMDAAAVRLERPVSYIRKMWKDAAA